MLSVREKKIAQLAKNAAYLFCACHQKIITQDVWRHFSEASSEAGTGLGYPPISL